MQFSAHEEYGLRCLLRLASAGPGASMTIPEISQAEGMSQAYVAKLMRILREGKMVVSERGQAGGYRLAQPAAETTAAEALSVLGGKIFDDEFCTDRYVGTESICTRSVNCSIRSLWQVVQTVVDQVLTQTTLQDLVRTEGQMTEFVNELVAIQAAAAPAETVGAD